MELCLPANVLCVNEIEEQQARSTPDRRRVRSAERGALIAPDQGLAKPPGPGGTNGMTEPNGAAQAVESLSPVAPAPDRSQPPPPASRPHPSRGRRLQLTVSVLLALIAIAAAVLSIRAFVGASANQYPGVIQPTQAISLNFSQVGYLSSLTAQPGDHVRAGQVLARLGVIGARAIGLTAQAAAAAVVADKQDLTVAEQAVNSLPAVKLAGVRRAKAHLAADEARLAQAQLALDQSTITAPASGLILSVNGAVGDLVGPNGLQIDGSSQPSQLAQQIPTVSPFSQAPQHSTTANHVSNGPLIQLAAGSPEMAAQVPESAMKDMRPGRQATVDVPALGSSFGARLVRVVPAPVQQNGQVYYQVLFALQRPSGQVLPGMSADVTLGR